MMAEIEATKPNPFVNAKTGQDVDYETLKVQMTLGVFVRNNGFPDEFGQTFVGRTFCFNADCAEQHELVAASTKEFVKECTRRNEDAEELLTDKVYPNQHQDTEFWEKKRVYLKLLAGPDLSD
eukprot:2057151-Rhodomonas_salina.1